MLINFSDTNILHLYINKDPTLPQQPILRKAPIHMYGGYGGKYTAGSRNVPAGLKYILC